MPKKKLGSRKTLTFEQAEGAEPLPRQLQLKKITKEFRARIWEVLVRSLNESSCSDGDLLYPKLIVTTPWLGILYDKHVRRDFALADEFTHAFSDQKEALRAIIVDGDYVQVLGFLQWLIRHQACPPDLPAEIDYVLQDVRAAYRVADSDTIIPIGSEAEAAAIKQVFIDIASTEFNGARSHLRSAAEQLTAGRFSASIRESIHAVESVARLLEPHAELSKALAKLEKTAKIHGALKSGFLSLYGYTSDEKGIRHALLEKDAPAADETDALFMMSACAAFVSYLINKARSAKLLPTKN